jgi:uncharacterized protein (TIGR00255 family)
MTGFGAGNAVMGTGRVLVEMRSVNHRFVEVRVRMPTELSEHGFFVEQYVRGRLNRGRFDVTVRLEKHLDSSSVPALDLARARALYGVFAKLRDELAPGTELPLSILGAVPGLLDSSQHFSVDDFRRAAEAALDAALGALETMRVQEGEKLHEELKSRLASAESLRQQIEKRSPELVLHYRLRLKERLDKLLDDSGIPLEKGRLEGEVAVLADRSDVTEELVRLASHFSQFSALLDSDEAVGRRLDFLLQEVGRETNTIGAKCQDAELSHLVVDLKAEVERLREQVQNVE